MPIPIDHYAGMYDIDVLTAVTMRSETIKKTRKPHKCFYCNKAIPTGSEAGKDTILYREEGYSVHCHHVPPGQCIQPKYED